MGKKTTKTLKEWVGNIDQYNAQAKASTVLNNKLKEQAKKSVARMTDLKETNRDAIKLQNTVKSSSVKMDNTTSALVNNLNEFKKLSVIIEANRGSTEALFSELDVAIDQKGEDVDEMHRTIQDKIKVHLDNTLDIIGKEREFYHENSISYKMDTSIVTWLDKKGIKVNRAGILAASTISAIAGATSGFFIGDKLWKTK